MDFEKDKYAGMDLRSLVEAMANIRDQHTSVKRQAADIWSEHEYLAKQLIPQQMESLGLSTANFPGLGRLELRHDVSVSIPKENKFDVYQWVEDNGYEDLIVGTINSSTFKAQVKKWIKDGEKFPIELINYNPFDNAVLVKAK